MIALETLAGIMDQLTGDAVKVGVMLMTIDSRELRADAQWVADCAAAACLHETVVRSALDELVNLSLIERSGRVLLTSLLPSGYKRFAQNGEGGERLSPSTQLVLSTEQYLSTQLVPEDQQVLPSTPFPEPDIAPHERRAVSVTSTQELTDLTWKGLLAALTELAESATGGRPLWDGRDRALLKQLVQKSTTDEVLRRATIMWNGPPLKWPAPPYDIGTLRFHWGKFGKITKGRQTGIIERNEKEIGKDYYKGTGSLKKGQIR